jgi:hypothetical protein
MSSRVYVGGLGPYFLWAFHFNRGTGISASEVCCTLADRE